MIQRGVCPVCNGTKRMSVPDYNRPYVKNGWWGYSAEDDKMDCGNCGSQYMYGRPSGEVRLNKEGNPCHHKYTSRTVGRCLTQYTCADCGDSYQIDSGD